MWYPLACSGILLWFSTLLTRLRTFWRNALQFIRTVLAHPWFSTSICTSQVFLIDIFGANLIFVGWTGVNTSHFCHMGIAGKSTAAWCTLGFRRVLPNPFTRLKKNKSECFWRGYWHQPKHWRTNFTGTYGQFGHYWNYDTTASFHRTIASTLLRSVYGYHPDTLNDPFVTGAKQAIDNLAQAAMSTSTYKAPWFLDVLFT